MNDINIAVIGCGFMGTLYARICHQLMGARVAAVFDADSERAQVLAQEVGAAAFSGADYSAMFRQHPEIDGVFICTPEDSHVAPAVAALEAGKHLLIEKPLTTSVADAQTIMNAAHGRDIISMIGYSLRFDPRYAAMKTAVQRGDLGELIHMFARRNMPLAVLKRLNGRVESPYWVGVHDIDVMRWLTGSEVVSVMAMATDRGMTEYKLQSVYYALLKFENGIVAALENAWSVNPLVGRPQPYTFRVEGTRGQLQVRSYEQGVTIYGEHALVEPDTVYMPTIYGRITGVYHDQIAYFVQCLRDGKQTDIPLSEGYKGVLVADAITQSAEQHREITLTIRKD